MAESIVSVPPNAIVDITPSLVNGWTPAATYGFKVYREGQRIWMEGVLEGTAATGTTICTLPAGSRPSTKQGFGGGWYKTFDVNTDGTVVCGTGSQVYMTGTTFRGQ